MCSHSSFYITSACKGDKNRQNTFFLLEESCICYPTNNCSLMPRFNQPNTQKKNCEWTAKYQILLEMCIVQHVELKSVFTFQPIKRPVSKTVKNAKPAATFRMFLSSTKYRQLCCLAVMVHIASPERRVATTKKKSHISIFDKKFSTNHNQTCPNLSQKTQKSITS